jgi:hypothetical protein
LKNALQIKSKDKKLINSDTKFEINLKNQNNFESKLKNQNQKVVAFELENQI